MLKRVFLIVAGLGLAVCLRAQGGFESPADTVYLRVGPVATVHVKSIKPSGEDAVSAYRIQTHESLDMTDKDIWSNVPGGFRWTAEQFSEGFKSLDVLKVVFADGFVLPFEEGALDRSLLLTAPSYKAAHGDFMAEGVVPLTREETRELIGNEAYYLGYRVRKNQARGGLAKLLVGAPAGFLCYLTRGSAVQITEIPSLVGGRMENIGSGEYRFNPLWQTGTGFAVATAAYGAAEMAVTNISIRKLASSFRDFQAPSAGAFRTRALLGGGLVLAGGAVTYLGYDRIAKDAGWSETYEMQTVAGVDVPVKVRQDGKKMAAPWLLPAAGALLVNFGITELTNGLTGLAGYKTLREAGLDRAQIHIVPTPYGMGVSMVF